MAARRSSYRVPRGRRRIYLLLIALVVIGFGGRVANNLIRGTGDKTDSGKLTVVRVIDGDTVELSNGETLRLAHVDTPESGEPLALVATRFLDSLVLGQVVEIVPADERRDKYGRLLGYLRVDTVNVGLALVERGLAYVLAFDHVDLEMPRIKLLLAGQRRAMEKKAGLWSFQREPEDFYVARRTSLRLHRPSCRTIEHANDVLVFKTREEALSQGYSPCRICRP